MKNLGRQLQIHYGNVKKSFLLFWLVVLALFILNLLLVAFMEIEGSIGVTFSQSTPEGEEVFSYSSFAILILVVSVFFHLAKTFNGYQECFGFAVSLGSTRRNYFAGLICFYLLLAAAMSVVLGGLFSLEAVIFQDVDQEHLNLVEILFPVSSNFFNVTAFYFGILIVATALFNLVAVLVYRVGKIFWLVLMAVLVLLLSVEPLREPAWDFIRFFTAEDNFTVFQVKLLGLAAVLFILGLPVLHRLEIR